MNLETGMYCLVGLGNPGETYDGTRHNVGFDAAARLAARFNVSIRRREFSALTAIVEVRRSMVLIMQPQTYMNRSGQSVAMAIEAHSIPTDNVVVVYDDLDLDLGQLRIRSGGGTGGHRGVASLCAELNTSDFPRIRIGIGRPPQGTDTVDYVLGRFATEDLPLVDATLNAAVEASLCVMLDGARTAMNRFNGQPITAADAGDRSLNIHPKQ